MRFAEADAGMDVERIEHQLIAAAAGRDLPCRGVRERVRAPDDESLERQPRVERRAAERFVHRHERHAGAHLRAVMACAVDLARGMIRHFNGLGFRCKRSDRGRTHAQFQTGDRGVLGLPIAEHALAVMGLDPVAQEACRHRQPHRALVDDLQLHPGKPTREHVFTKFSAQPALDPLPAILIRAHRFGLLFFAGKGREDEQLKTIQARLAQPWANSTANSAWGRWRVQKRTQAPDYRAGQPLDVIVGTR